MAWEEILQNVTREAAGDLSGSQYRAVTIDGNGRVAAVATAGAQPFGVLQNDPNALGKAATVAVFGVTKMEAGAAITNGARVTTDGTGRATTALTAGVDTYFGVALEAAGAAGEIIPVLIQYGGTA